MTAAKPTTSTGGSDGSGARESESAASTARPSPALDVLTALDGADGDSMNVDARALKRRLDQDFADEASDVPFVMSESVTIS